MHNHILDYRKKFDLTQQALAEKIGVSRQTVISVEKGDCIPSLALAFKIAGFFQIPIEQIFDDRIQGGEHICKEQI